MAAKTANILARVEPDVKAGAEAVMAKLGVPASTVINMLYKQIIMTQSIPFSLSLPKPPVARDEMNMEMFNTMIEEGLEQAKAGQGYSLDEAFELLSEET